MAASPESPANETGWLTDFIYTGDAFETGLAMFADPGGGITRFSRDSADLARAERLSNRAILPGLVNVHSHAFQRVIRGRTEHRTAAQRDTFWTWRESMYHAANQLTPEAMYHAARMAFLEMALSGITTVGEFHYVHHGSGGQPYADRNLLAFQVLRAADEVGLRIGELSLGSLADGLLPWGWLDNRPFLRCLRGFGLCLWRLEQFEEAERVFDRLLWLNPADN